jgi:hypothetical protein
VRLACVKHAASVHSEPGSNSQVHQDHPNSSRHQNSPSRSALTHYPARFRPIPIQPSAQTNPKPLTEQAPATHPTPIASPSQAIQQKQNTRTNHQTRPPESNPIQYIPENPIQLSISVGCLLVRPAKSVKQFFSATLQFLPFDYLAFRNLDSRNTEDNFERISPNPPPSWRHQRRVVGRGRLLGPHPGGVKGVSATPPQLF